MQQREDSVGYRSAGRTALYGLDAQSECFLRHRAHTVQGVLVACSSDNGCWPLLSCRRNSRLMNKILYTNKGAQIGQNDMTCPAQMFALSVCMFRQRCRQVLQSPFMFVWSTI